MFISPPPTRSIRPTLPMLLFIIITLLSLSTAVFSATSFSTSFSYASDTDLIPTFIVSWTDPIYPLIWSFKIGYPVESTFFDTTWTPVMDYCYSSDDEIIPLSVTRRAIGMTEPNDNVLTDSYSVSIPTGNPGQPYSLRCRYNSPYPLPLLVRATHNTNAVYPSEPILFFMPPRNRPSTGYYLSAFAASTTTVSSNSFTLHLANLTPYTDSTLGSLLSFRIVPSSGSLTFPTIATCYAQDGLSTGTVTIVRFNTDYIILGGTKQLPPNTYSMSITIATSIPSLPSIEFGALFNNYWSTSPTPPGDIIILNPSIGSLITLQSVLQNTSPNANFFKTGILVQHTELTYTWEVLPQPSLSSPTFTLSPPPFYRDAFFFTKCSITSVDGTNPQEIQILPSIYTFTIAPITETKILTCLAIFEPQFLQSPSLLDSFPYHYLAVQVISSTRPGSTFQYITSRPWSVTGIPDKPPTIKLRQASPPKIIPNDFSYPNNPPTWTISHNLPGMFAPSIPQSSFTFSAIYNGVDLRPEDVTYFGWSEGETPTTSSRLPTTHSLDVMSPTYRFAFEPSTSAISFMIDPVYKFKLDIDLDSFPTTTNPHADFRLTSTPSTPPAVTQRMEYQRTSLLSTFSTLPIAHLPNVVTKCSNDGKRDFRMTEEPSIPIVFTIPKLPLNYPNDADLATFPDHSVWKTQTEVIIYPGTLLEGIIECVQCTFSSRPQTTGSDFWTLRALSEGPNTISFNTQSSSSVEYTLNTNLPTFQITVDVLAANRGDEFFIKTSGLKFTYPGAKSPILLPATHDSTFSFASTVFGTSKIQFNIPSTTDPSSTNTDIPRLIDNNNVQLTIKPVIQMIPGVKLLAQFTPDNDGLTSQSIELWYHDTITNKDIRFRSITTTTPTTLTDLKFLGVGEVIKNAFFKFLYPNPLNRATPRIQDSVYFDIIPACMGPHSTIIGEYQSICTGTNEICLMTAGICTVLPPTGGDDDNDNDPRPIPEKCPRCGSTTTKSCIPADPLSNRLEQCNCLDGWEGPSCQMNSKCGTIEQQKKSKCYVNNGYSELSLIDNTCSSKCTCYNEWSGLSCQTCTLQCYNGGIAYNDCARCGCDKGYNGLQCQCQSVEAKIIINGYNHMLINTKGQLSSSSSSTTDSTPSPMVSTTTATSTTNDVKSSLFLFESHYLSGSFVLSQLSKTITPNDLELYSLLKELYRSFQSPLTNNDNGKFILSLNPIVVTSSPTTTNDGNNKTEFHITIRYNCPEYNPNITTFDQLSTLWKGFTNGLIEQDVVQKYFIFPQSSSLSPIEIGDLTQTPEQLPPDDERAVNSAINYQIGFRVTFGALVISLIASILV